ncbi:restriction endonuclease subunit S [Blautia sp.]|uniref:restriction endonuclease subunit S n=1 Tax=Blautia sp. TaxID=1955243 RepID=UPI003AF4D1A3
MAMKESGIEWVGLMPDTWSVIPNKYVMHKEKNLCEKWTGEDVMSLTMNGVIVRDLQNPTGKMPATFDGYQYIEDGDLLMCLFDIDVTPRCVGKVTHNGVTSPAYSNFKVHDNASRDYFYYYYLMVDNTKELLHLAKNLRHSFTEEQLGQLKVPMPPLSEQQAIADYLDETCSKIDEIIAEAKASIDEYKELKQSVIFEAVTKGLDKNVEMKDSGVEWIGEIPVDWNIAKINRVAWTTSGATPLRSKETEYYDNAVIRWVRTLDLNNGHVTDSSEKITETALKNSSCSIMPVKTVCVAMYGGSGTIGKSGILEVECATNQAICSIVSDKKVLNPDYLHYVIMAVRKYWMKYAVGTRKDPNINQQIIAQMRIPIPQLSKQDIIVNHLDKVTDKCDSLISEKESLINDLEAYKKSLIYEVVTGKRRVV